MPKTVLVVDDEALIALDIEMQITELGHRALMAVNIEQARKLIETEEIDVAIIDWHLRDDVSATIVEMLQARGVPFILCSGSALDELRELFPRTPLVTKPFATQTLLGALNSAVGETIQ